MRVPLALLLAAVLAGCSAAPPGEPAVTPAPSSGEAPARKTVAAACPEEPPPAPPDGEPAPTWRAGQWWNYTMLDEQGVARGHGLYEVLGCADVAGTMAYRVRETWLEYGSSAGHPETPRVSLVHYAIGSLHQVWAECDTVWRSIAPCQGDVAFWDFPLRDGKEWTYTCCSDLPMTMHARAEQGNASEWRISHTGADGTLIETWTYSSELGLFTRKDGNWWNGPGRWELREHGDGPLPEPFWREGSLFSYDAACVHEEARGPAGLAPLRGAWRASVPGLMVRLSRAVEDPLVGEPYVDDRALRLVWNTTSGHMESALHGDPAQPPTIAWRSARDVSWNARADGIEWMRGVLARFAFNDARGIDVHTAPSVRGFEVRYGQSVDGRLVSGAGGYLETAYGTVLYWGPIYDLREGPQVSEEEALEAAKAYHRCHMDRAGATEETGYRFEGADAPDLAVRNGTLAYRFLLRYSEPAERQTHCGSRGLVYVDAITAAVIGRASPLCF